MKQSHLRYKPNLVGTWCSASVLDSAVVDAQQRVPTLTFLHRIGPMPHRRITCSAVRPLITSRA